MDAKLLAVVATVIAGGFIALQAPINSTLGKTVGGTLPAATISFGVGLIALVALTLLVGGGFGELGEARTLPWYYLAGGLLGAIYVSTALLTVRELGAGGVTAATIAGQLACSLVLDKAGVLGLEERDLDLSRVLGVAMLAAGTYLVVRD